MSGQERLIVTLDGPAGSGKSTVAHQLAARLGVDFLDTGAMYRGLTAHALMRGIDPVEEPFYVTALARGFPPRFDWTQDPPALCAGEFDVSHRLRDSDVTQAVSDVARISGVRQILVEAQRQIGREHPRLVTEGRDQGSVVFPDAEARFFLTAKPEIRAQRRADQLRAAGHIVSVPSLTQQILERDRKDATRTEGPLICPEGAEQIDTSAMTLDEVVDLLESRVREAGFA